MVTTLIRTAKITLWGEFVGALAYTDDSGIASFEYDPAWVRKGLEISPIRMPLSNPLVSFPSLNYDTYKGLPAAFADTLPDDFGNAVINAWLSRNGRDPDDCTPVERLLYIGKRGMGALEYEPATEVSKAGNEDLELGSLLEVAQNILDQRAGLKEKVGRSDNADAMSSILQVGTSAGGARAKALVAIDKMRKTIKSGQVDAPEGFAHYLLKFDGVIEHQSAMQTFGDPQGYGRMEYAYYLMAREAGIDMMPSELLIDGERAHFMTKRFDREGNNKLHFLSLCALDHADYKKPGTYSYEELIGVARKLKLSRDEAIEIFRRMVFNVIARNQDDHSKNFGFVLSSPESSWRLSPAFDVAYSYNPSSQWVNAHQLTINGKRDGFSREDLLAVSKLIGNFREKDAVAIIIKVMDVVSEWHHYASKAGVPGALKEQIAGNHRKL